MDKVITFVKQTKQLGKKIVLATGVFDFLHQEHLTFLKKASQAGDVLMVGIESDARVKKLKSKSRPVNNQRHRQRQLQALTEVDLAFILPEKFDTTQDHLALLKLIRPQVLAVSSHTPFLEQKQKLLKQVGGEMKVVHDHNPDISTTIIINKKELQ